MPIDIFNSHTEHISGIANVKMSGNCMAQKWKFAEKAKGNHVEFAHC